MTLTLAFFFLSRRSVEGEGKSCGAFPQHSARARAVSVHIDILTSLFIVSKNKKQDRRTTAWTRCELAGRLQVRFQHEDGRTHRDQQCSVPQHSDAKQRRTLEPWYAYSEILGACKTDAWKLIPNPQRWAETFRW